MTKPLYIRLILADDADLPWLLDTIRVGHGAVLEVAALEPAYPYTCRCETPGCVHLVEPEVEQGQLALVPEAEPARLALLPAPPLDVM